MELCSYNHKEICYTSSTCPLCEQLNYLIEEEQYTESLEEKLNTLNEEYDSLQSYHKELVDQVRTINPELLL